MVIPIDKGGLFAVVGNEEGQALLNDNMCLPQYRPVPRDVFGNDLAFLLRDMCSRCRDHARRLELGLQVPGLRVALCKTLHKKRGYFPRVLCDAIWLLKIHKPQGQVGPRILHSW